MKWYSEVPIWENRRRVAHLYNFRALVERYFANVRVHYLEGPIEEGEARDVRPQINRELGETQRILGTSGVSDHVTFREAPVAGGRVMPGISILANIFNLHQMAAGPGQVMDCLDRAIGVLENDRRAAWRRTLNPLYWVNRVLIAVARVPFVAMEELGFDGRKAEATFGGRLVKAILYAAPPIAALLKIVEFVREEEWLRQIAALWGGL